MKNTNYIVWFSFGGNVQVYAASPTKAAILACAKRIKYGANIEILFIENLDNDTIEKYRSNLGLIEQ